MPHDGWRRRAAFLWIGVACTLVSSGCLRTLNPRASGSGLPPELTPAGGPVSNVPNTATPASTPNSGRASARPSTGAAIADETASSNAIEPPPPRENAPSAVLDPPSAPEPAGPSSAPSKTPLLDAELKRVDSVTRQHVEALSTEGPIDRADTEARAEIVRPSASMEVLSPSADGPMIDQRPTPADVPAPSAPRHAAPRELPDSIVPTSDPEPVPNGPAAAPAIGSSPSSISASASGMASVSASASTPTSTSPSVLSNPSADPEPSASANAGEAVRQPDVQKISAAPAVPELGPAAAPSPPPPPPPIETVNDPQNDRAAEADSVSSSTPDGPPKMDEEVLVAQGPAGPAPSPTSSVEAGAEALTTNIDGDADEDGTPEARPTLRIAELRLCRNILDFGVFDPLDADALKPGQEILVYCEMAGLAYRPRPRGEEFVSRLSALVECRAEGSETSVWEYVPPIAVDVCRHQRRDYFVGYRVNLPRTLQPGRYHLRLVETDLIAERAAAAECAFRIVP